MYTHIYNLCIYLYTYFKIGSFMKRFVVLEFINLFCSYIHVCFNLVAFIREDI